MLKLLHILGAVLFLGNIIATAVWKMLADASGKPAVAAYAARLVLLTDWLFTATGATLLAVSGGILAARAGFAMQPGWLLWGQGLFVASALIWLIFLLPIQFRQARMARAFDPALSELPADYRALTRRWAIWGGLATVLPVISLGLMVLKPVM